MKNTKNVSILFYELEGELINLEEMCLNNETDETFTKINNLIKCIKKGLKEKDNNDTKELVTYLCDKVNDNLVFHEKIKGSIDTKLVKRELKDMCDCIPYL